MIHGSHISQSPSSSQSVAVRCKAPVASGSVALSKSKSKPFPLHPSPFTLLFLALWAILIPLTAHADVYEAQKAYSKGDYVLAETEYRKALDEEPDDPEITYNLANCLYFQGKYRDAIDLYDQALVNAEPELQSKVLYNIGNAWYRIGQQQLENDQPATRKSWAKALEQYDGALVATPDYFKADANKAFIQEQIDNLIMYDIVLNSNYPKAVELKGAGNFDRGTTQKIEVTLKDPDNWRWDGWEGEGPADPKAQKTTVKMEADRKLTAQVTPLHILTIKFSPEGSGTTESEGKFPRGEPVDIAVQSNFGWRFDHWEGEGIVDPQSPATQTVLNSDTTLTAVFREAYELVFDLEGTTNE